jgi:flagellin-like hook-associated protein FlgL
MSVSQQRAEAQGMFAYARRILSGQEEPVEAPIEPVDIRSGIDRALRQTKRGFMPASVAEAAARAVSVVEGTLVAIDTINDYLTEAMDLTAAALSHADMTKRAMIADRYEELRGRVDTVAGGATFDGTNLIDGARGAIELMLPDGGQPRHAIGHITLVAGERGLALKAPSEQFGSNDEIEAARATLVAARNRLQKAAETFLNQASLLQPQLGMPEQMGEVA